jgi:hypothetical protein
MYEKEGAKMIKKSIARKEISREFIDGKETVVNERVDFVFDEDVLFSLNIIYNDDYEMAYMAGVYYDFTQELYFIRVDKVLEDLDVRISDDGCNYESEKKIIKYLQKWKGWEIWVGG